jgi:HEAT repeat protein
VEKVIATLAIEDSELRYWLSGILKSWPKSVYPHICALFYQDKYPVHLAAYAAGIIKEPYFVPALREILKEQDNLLVLYATWALSEILPGEEIRAIWGMLSKLDAREHVVFSEVVRKYKNSAPAYLLSGLKSAEKQLVLNSCYFCGLLELTEAVPVLEELLSNRDEGVCLAAAEAFLKLDYRAIIPKLRSVLTRDLSSDFRLKILSILGVFGEDDVVPVILKMMCTAANEAERDIYSREIFRMGIGVVPRLIKHLAHEEPILRKVAAELLLEFGSLAVPELKKELVGRDPNRKYWAAKILKTEGR